MEESTASRYGSRKFIFSVATVVIASVMCYTGTIDAETWKHVVVAVVGAYLAANVFQKATAKPSNTEKTASSTT